VRLGGLSFAPMTPSPSSEVVRAARGSAADGAMKRAYVRRMFAAVAPRYDLLNHLLSLNLDRRWRRAAVARLGWEARPDGVYLDLCAGTMDLAAALGREPRFRGRVIGADFVVPMLELGRGKSARAAPVAADALLLPFPDRAFDGALVGFGVRNLTDLDAGRDLRRVTRPVSVDKEITEIADRCMKSAGGGPALLFERPTLLQGGPSRYPVAVNLFGSEKRMALALGVSCLDEIGERIATLLNIKV